MLSELNSIDMILLFVGAIGIGVSKSGLPGIGMLHIILYATVFEARESTGVLLPMLIVGDLLAIRIFGREADWVHLRKLCLPTLAGVVLGWILMDWLHAKSFQLVVGVIILSLCVVQALKLWRNDLLDSLPHTHGFAVLLGLVAGITTMLANAAGPVVALYLLAVNLPKWELIGTSAWMFLVLNVVKVPFSFELGLIHRESLKVNLLFAPAIPIGFYLGKHVVSRISQGWFNGILLTFTAIAALRLCLVQ